MLPPDPTALTGLSASFALPARVVVVGGVLACVVLAVEEMASKEFFRDPGPEAEAEAPLLPFFFDLVLEPTGRLAPEPRFLFLITSVFKLSGLTTPWSFKKRPQALQRG